MTGVRLPRPFSVVDEVYTFNDASFSRERVHVLTSIDYSKMPSEVKAQEPAPKQEDPKPKTQAAQEPAPKQDDSKPKTQEPAPPVPEPQQPPAEGAREEGLALTARAGFWLHSEFEAMTPLGLRRIKRESMGEG